MPGRGRETPIRSLRSLAGVFGGGACPRWAVSPTLACGVGGICCTYPPTPLPRQYLGDVFNLAGAGGGYKSIISFQRGSLRPGRSRLATDRAGRRESAPFVNPPRFILSYLRASYLPRGCKGAAAPLKIQIKFKNLFPLPYRESTDYISLALREGAGGGHHKTRPSAGETGVGTAKLAPRRAGPEVGTSNSARAGTNY